MSLSALLSVSDKTGIVDFARELHAQGIRLLSTGGTAKLLAEAGLPVTEVSEVTGFPEMLDGRVKTLHPAVHGGLLAIRDSAEHAAFLTKHQIAPIDLVCINLYPFQQTVAKPDVTFDEAVENIDIGGPSMVRSAAKNHAHVAIVTRPSQYVEVLDRLKVGTLDEHYRRTLAAAAFEMTAVYDRAISNYMAKIVAGDAAPAFGARLDLSFRLQQELRYGENPHQKAAFYVEESPAPGTLATAKQLNGKELSYNNLLDLDSAKAIVAEYSLPAACVIKHNNPCGCAVAESLADAFHKAYEGDPVSAFGSIIGLNRVVDVATAERMCEPGRFIEAIIAPGYDEEAYRILTTKPKWKSNVRLMQVEFSTADRGAPDFRRVSGGLLVQDRDDLPQVDEGWRVVTSRSPSAKEMADLRFAWAVCRHVKSNAIVFAKDGMLLGAGAGQMSRLDSSMIAAYKAGDRSKGGVVASDAFFPFRDGIDAAAKAGIVAAIQPGGSKNDDEVIAACNEHGIAMIFTGQRHFRH